MPHDLRISFDPASLGNECSGLAGERGLTDCVRRGGRCVAELPRAEWPDLQTKEFTKKLAVTHSTRRPLYCFHTFHSRLSRLSVWDRFASGLAHQR